MNALTELEAWQAIARGGPVMAALALISILLYQNVVITLVTVYRIRLNKIKSILKSSDDRVRDRNLKAFRNWLKGRLKIAGMMIAAAPLLGLLGTVMGMLSTFQSLATRAGQETANQVADGVSMALITTQTGLTIAIPALFMVYWIQRIAQKREAEYLEFHGKQNFA